MTQLHSLSPVFSALRAAALWNFNVPLFVAIFALGCMPVATNIVCLIACPQLHNHGHAHTLCWSVRRDSLEIPLEPQSGGG